MNQDDWIRFQDKIPTEYRWIFDATRDHDMAAYGSMLGAVLAALGEIEAKQDGFSHTFGALVSKQDLIAEAAKADRADRAEITLFLERQDKRMEAVGAGLVLLRAEFQATGESLNHRLTGIEATLEASHQEHARSIEERARLRIDMEESKADRVAIRAEQRARDVAIADRIEERDAAYQERLGELHEAIEGLRTLYNTLQIQYGELEESINGRLTRLIERSEAVARLEGRDEERAHPGGE